MTMLHPIVPETEESGAVSAYVPGIARLCCGRNRPAKARTRVRNCAWVVGWSVVKRAETTSSSAAASRQLAPSARRPNTCTAGRSRGGASWTGNGTHSCSLCGKPKRGGITPTTVRDYF